MKRVWVLAAAWVFAMMIWAMLTGCAFDPSLVAGMGDGLQRMGYTIQGLPDPANPYATQMYAIQMQREMMERQAEAERQARQQTLLLMLAQPNVVRCFPTAFSYHCF